MRQLFFFHWNEHSARNKYRKLNLFDRGVIGAGLITCSLAVSVNPDSNFPFQIEPKR